MKELKFQLENKLTFANVDTGKDDKTIEVTLKAPSYDGRKYYFKIYQHLSSAIMKFAQNNRSGSSSGDDQGAENPDAETVLMILSSGDADLSMVVDDFGYLVLDCGYINDKTRIVETHLKSISPNDMLQMCGEYMAFFIAPSLLSKTKKHGSKR